jgi:hypothetical protein
MGDSIFCHKMSLRFKGPVNLISLDRGMVHMKVEAVGSLVRYE